MHSTDKQEHSAIWFVQSRDSVLCRTLTVKYFHYGLNKERAYYCIKVAVGTKDRKRFVKVHILVLGGKIFSINEHLSTRNNTATWRQGSDTGNRMHGKSL